METGVAPVPPKSVVQCRRKQRDRICVLLNEWASHGWNLSRHFIQITWNEGCKEYVVFYDSILDEEYVDKKKII